MLPFVHVPRLFCPQKYATFQTLPLAHLLCLRAARKSMLHFSDAFSSLAVYVCVLPANVCYTFCASNMKTNLFERERWLQLSHPRSAALCPRYHFPWPCPPLNAINLTVFALLCSFNQPRSISVHAEHILLITFATTQCPSSGTLPASALCLFWLRVFAQVYEILLRPEKSNRSGCSSTRSTKATFSGIAFLWLLRASVYVRVCAEFHELYKQINCLFVATICGNFVICALVLPARASKRWHHLCLFCVEGGCWHAPKLTP